MLQGVTGRPGARFGPGGIRRGSWRIEPDVAWDIATGMYISVPITSHQRSKSTLR